MGRRIGMLPDCLSIQDRFIGMLPSENPIGDAVLSVSTNHKFCNHTPVNILSGNVK